MLPYNITYFAHFISFLKAILVTALVLAAGIGVTRAELKVVTSIKPVHSLVSGVMEGVSVPDLIVTGTASPHNYSLKPSQAQMLEKAELVFWIGYELEAFLVKPIAHIAENARSVELIRSEGLNKLALGYAADQKHHSHGEENVFDPHIWLDVENAMILVGKIVAELVVADPENATTYKNNASALTSRLNSLNQELETTMSGLAGREYISFHSAYRYFTEHFGIISSASIVISPEVMPGAERIREIRTKVRRSQTSCVLAEPQFETKLVHLVTQGTEVQIGTIDPLGAMLENGPQLYFALIRNVATSIRNCLLRTD